MTNSGLLCFVVKHRPDDSPSHLLVVSMSALLLLRFFSGLAPIPGFGESVEREWREYRARVERLWGYLQQVVGFLSAAAAAIPSCDLRVQSYGAIAKVPNNRLGICKKLRA